MAGRANKNPIPIPWPAVAIHPLDRNVEAMLQKSQPGYFSGEGDNVGKQLEEWMEKMEDYFALAHSSKVNQAMMGRFKLEKSAKLWWQDHCQENGIDPNNATWEYISTKLSKNYQSRTYKIERLNKFLDCTQNKDNLETFYQRFLKLLKYAPPRMTQEEKVARFVSKLNSSMNTHLQALRLTTFADVLDAGRLVEEEVTKIATKDSKPSQSKENLRVEMPLRKREAKRPTPNFPQKFRLPSHLFEKAKRERLCLRCLDPDHQIKKCPYSVPTRSEETTPPNNGGFLQRGGNGNDSRGNNYNNPNLIPVANNKNFNQNQGNGGNNGNRQNPPRPP